MPTFLKPEALNDAKRENRKESKKFNRGGSSTATVLNPDLANSSGPTASDNETAQDHKTDQSAPDNTTAFTMPPPPIQEPVRDEFQERYDEYFKKVGGVIAGDMVVNFIDDLKTNFLYLYAKKNGIDVGKDALKMDEKSRGFAAFLVDEAVKNNLFTWIKKYPLIAGLGVIVISGGSTFLMLQMLKKSTDESKKKDELIEKLQKEKRDAERRAATVVEDLNKMKAEADTPDVNEFIKNI